MTITLYKIPDDKRALSKTLNATTKIADITGNIKTDCDILNPVFELSYSDSYLPVNYMYVPKFNRYYFVDPPKLSAQRMYLTCHVDVLESYKSQIEDLNCVIARQETAFNAYLNDGVWRNLQAKDVLTLPFTQSFYRPCNFVMTTGGKP